MEKYKLQETIREMSELSENEVENKERLIELAQALTAHYKGEDKKEDESQLKIPFEGE